MQTTTNTTTKKNRTFVHLAKGDQRLCVETFTNPETGHSFDRYYVFDNSGLTPESTDDGPLRLNTNHYLEVTERCVYAKVFCERNNDEQSRVGFSHAAALKLFCELRARGLTLQFKSSVDENLTAALNLCGHP